MRDENGFKCHVQSESHVRQMLLVGEDSKKYIADYSSQFQRDFLQLLRTAHGEKKININHFYQEYISNKQHVHMNATRWPSLTEFAKFLGREGICRVEEGDKGLEVAWIDNSPEALRRQDAIRKKERQDRGDEEREQRLIREQIEKARREALEKGEEDFDPEAGRLQREEGEKIKLNMSMKPAPSKAPSPPTSDPIMTAVPVSSVSSDLDASTSEPALTKPPSPSAAAEQPAKVSLKMGSNKPKNVFAAAKKNALGGSKGSIKEPPKKMSEAERIMKEELERKRLHESRGGPQGSFKRQKVA